LDGGEDVLDGADGMDAFDPVDSTPSGTVPALEEPCRRAPVFLRVLGDDFGEDRLRLCLGCMD
jgi:hypothetical protein